MKTFNLADVRHMTGATASQVDYWVRREIFFPQKKASLSGDRNKFSLLNIVEVAQAAELSDVLGMSTDRMKSAAHRQQLTPK